MKTTDPRLTDTRITEGSGNIFIDLGFDEDEARVMQWRAELMIRIEMQLTAQGWTQAEAAKVLKITQPRVSKLKRGVWQDFSFDMLLTLASRAGLHPQVKFT